MHQNIDFSKMLRGFFRHRRDLLIAGHVTFFDPFAVHFFSQRFHAALEHLTRVTDSQIRAFALERLRDSPRDRALVRQTKDQRILTFQ